MEADCCSDAGVGQCFIEGERLMISLKIFQGKECHWHSNSKRVAGHQSFGPFGQTSSDCLTAWTVAASMRAACLLQRSLQMLVFTS